MKSSRVFIVLVVLLASSVSMGAMVSTWTNWQNNQDWFDGGNWNTDPNDAPGVNDEAHLNVPAIPSAIVGASGDVGRVVMESDAVLEIAAAGNLNDVGQFLAGNAPTSTPSVVVDGVLTVLAEFAIGTTNGASGDLTINSGGIVNANGGWLIFGYVGGATTSGTCTVNSGGTLNVTGMLGLGWLGQGTLTVSGGTVSVGGVVNLGVSDVAANGDIILSGGGEMTSAGLNMGNSIGTGSLLIGDGCRYTNTAGFVQPVGSTITFGGAGTGEFVFTLAGGVDMTFVVNTVAGVDWIFPDGPVLTDNGDGTVTVTNGLSLFDSSVSTVGTATPLVLGQYFDIFDDSASQAVFADSDPNLPPETNFVEWATDLPVIVESLQMRTQHDTGVPNRAATNFKVLAKTIGSLTFDVVLYNEVLPFDGTSYPFSTLYEIDVDIVNPSFFQEFRAEFEPANLTGETSGVRVLYIGAMGVTSLQSDLDLDRIVDADDIDLLTQNWLVSNLETSTIADVVLDDYEGYANEAALDASYFGAIWDSGSGTTSTSTLLTAPADVFAGSQSLRWNYDNTHVDPFFTETIFLLPASVDITGHDELHIMLNRHVGNSKENPFYVRFLNGGFAQSNESAEYYVTYAEGSTQTPTGWTEWVIDLSQPAALRNGFTLGQLTDVQAVVIGVAGGHLGFPDSGGAGTIDFDDLTLVDTIGCTAIDATDLNEDCTTNLLDFAIISQDWLATY